MVDTVDTSHEVYKAMYATACRNLASVGATGAVSFELHPAPNMCWNFAVIQGGKCCRWHLATPPPRSFPLSILGVA